MHFGCKTWSDFIDGLLISDDESIRTIVLLRYECIIALHEMERILEREIVAYFSLLSRNFPRMTEKNHENIQDNCCSVCNS
jgi:hypothetical protein